MRKPDTILAHLRNKYGVADMHELRLSLGMCRDYGVTCIEKCPIDELIDAVDNILLTALEMRGGA
jgi:hypothetical protein